MNIIIEEKDRSVKGNRYLINLFMYPSPVDIGKIKGTVNPLYNNTVCPQII